MNRNAVKCVMFCIFKEVSQILHPQCCIAIGLGCVSGRTEVTG